MPPRRDLPWGVLLSAALAFLGAFATSVIAINQARASAVKVEAHDKAFAEAAVEHARLEANDKAIADIVARAEKALDENTKTLQSVQLELAALRKK
jgi:hypothetical protein